MKWLGQLEGALAGVARTDAAQAFSASQKAQGRANIGLPDLPTDGGNYILGTVGGLLTWVLAPASNLVPAGAVLDVDNSPVLDADDSYLLDVS